MKKLGFLSTLLGVFAIGLAGLLLIVNWIGTDAELYERLQLRAGVLSYAGISRSDLELLDGSLANCLEGDADALDRLHVNVNGTVQRAFNERELTHMEDCRKLFELSRLVLLICAIAGPLLLIAGFLMQRERKKLRLAAWLAPLLIILPLAALAVWAVINFDAAFTFFHHVLFTNDLWLLDPRTDLLIRICPESMFMSMGIYIGVIGLVWLLLVSSFVTLLSYLLPQRKPKKCTYELQFEDDGEG